MDSTEPSESDERRTVLTRIWMAQAAALATILEETPPGDLQAAMLQAARQFLSDNHVDVNSLAGPEDAGKQMAALLDRLPRFEDHGDGQQSAASDS